MTPTEKQSENPSRRPFATVLLASALLAVIAALTSTSGCGKPPPGLKPDEKTLKGDPWKVAGQRLKKDTDLAGCRAALGGLVNDLNTQNKESLPSLTEAELAELAKLVPLTAEDRDEVRATTFTAHDSAYLGDCLYLRDTARSLALHGLKSEEKADAAFAWVCRQVYLRPWVRVADRPEGGTALPPTTVLRRGFGSGLERMYVFLALLQQLELDGCLIGPPDAGTLPAGLPLLTPDKKAYVTGAPRGPFWAVGVRIGTDMRLYDPWRGQPFPATLTQLKANPDAAWFADAANTSGATPDDAKKATAFLAVPVSSLSARMATVDAKLKGNLGAKLSYNAKALRESFPDPKPAFWNPPDEPQLPSAYTYGRASRTFLPIDIGGNDRGPAGSRVYDAYQREQLPVSVFRVPEGLAQEGIAGQRLRAAAAGMLWLSYIEPPNPRERIQRGLFQDAAKDLVAKQETYSAGLERLRLNKDADQQISEWISAIDGLYQEIGVARLKMDKNAEATSLAQIENHWKLPGALYLVDRLSSEVGLAEATLLLALCKHELAERSQARVDQARANDATGAEVARLLPDALDSWKTAFSAWRTYEQLASAHAGFPGRGAHAHALATRAEKFANPPKK